jgi:hypothetical protein
MRLSPRTLDKLTGVITGDGGPYPYRSGPQIISFFNALGWNDTYGPDFGSRNQHTREKLDALNGNPRMRDAILAAFQMWGEPDVDCEAAARDFNRLLHRDGYRLAKVFSSGWIESGREVDGVPYFDLVPITSGMPWRRSATPRSASTSKSAEARSAQVTAQARSQTPTL